MGKGRLLTKEEIDYIMTHHKYQTPAKIASVLKRPTTTIRNFLARRGLLQVSQVQGATVLKKFLDRIQI